MDQTKERIPTETQKKTNTRYYAKNWGLEYIGLLSDVKNGLNKACGCGCKDIRVGKAINNKLGNGAKDKYFAFCPDCGSRPQPIWELNFVKSP